MYARSYLDPRLQCRAPDIFSLEIAILMRGESDERARARLKAPAAVLSFIGRSRHNGPGSAAGADQGQEPCRAEPR